MNAVTFYSAPFFDWVLDHVSKYNMFIIQSVATCSALIWLLFRTWQTLGKPVSELISILGFEVPDPPEVSLSCIKSDSVTLHWSKRDPQKSATKYLIQVNGRNGIAETSWLETAVTIVGLSPVNDYFIRVISVSPSSFQARSSVIRVRTCSQNGCPALDSNLSPSNSTFEETVNGSGDSTSDDGLRLCVEDISIPEGLTSTYREINAFTLVTRNSGQRRNSRGKIICRKKSSSTVNAEMEPSPIQSMQESKESMPQLTMQLKSLNRDREKVAREMTKEIEDFNAQFADICKNRDKKKLILKEKEEASEKLKKEVNHAERLNRQAQMRKSQKEKLLKEKHAERLKMEQDMKRWKKEIEDMRLKRSQWQAERDNAEKKHQANATEIKLQIKNCQASLNIIEEEIRLKGSQIKHLEKNRKVLSACENEEQSRLRGEHEDREWEITEQDLLAKLNIKSQQHRELASCLHQQEAYLLTLQNRSSTFCQGYYSGLDYDTTGAQVVADSRSNRNRNCRSISPISRISMPCSSFATPGTFSCQSPAFAPGPYIDMRNDSTIDSPSEFKDDMTDEDYHVLTAGAPLSPTASLLLPSNIFADDDPPNSSILIGSPISAPTVLFTNSESQSICSSSHSPNLITSPPKSSQQHPAYGTQSREYVQSERSFPSPKPSLSAIGPPKTLKHSNNKSLRNLFLPRVKVKNTDHDASISRPISLSHCSTFPNFLDEDVTTSENKHRRIAFPSGWAGFLHRASTTRESLSERNTSFIATPNSNSQRLTSDLTKASLDDLELKNTHSSSPYARSVVSFELPRPSTDSAPFGWGPAQDNITTRNSPLSTDWSLHTSNNNSISSQINWPSNFPNRTSFRYGSDTAFLSRLADDDDDFLPPSEVSNGQFSQPSIIGAIGTRNSMSYQTGNTPRLNPEAPAFQKLNFNNYTEIENDKRNNGEADELQSSVIKNTTVSLQSNVKHCPASRDSRDKNSVHTQRSASEFYNILDCDTSETLESSLNGKEKEESSLQRLLRKGSSSKFSISSFRNKESGLFSGKKSANSDLNSSSEREGSMDRVSNGSKTKSLDSVTRSPSLGKNGIAELIQSKDKDHASKDGRLSMSWGRFGFRVKKGRESLEIIDKNEESCLI